MISISKSLGAILGTNLLENYSPNRISRIKIEKGHEIRMIGSSNIKEPQKESSELPYKGKHLQDFTFGLLKGKYNPNLDKR